MLQQRTSLQPKRHLEKCLSVGKRLDQVQRKVWTRSQNNEYRHRKRNNKSNHTKTRTCSHSNKYGREKKMYGNNRPRIVENIPLSNLPNNLHHSKLQASLKNFIFLQKTIEGTICLQANICSQKQIIYYIEHTHTHTHTKIIYLLKMYLDCI